MPVLNNDNALTPEGLGAARLPVGGDSIFHALVHNQAGNALLVYWNGTTLTLPTGTGYAKGCKIVDSTNGKEYLNIGTATVASFVQTSGGSLDLSGAAAVVSIIDNTAAALAFKQGSNSYITLVTTDSSEAITLHKNTTASGTLTSTGAFTASSTSALNDDVTVASNKALAVTTADKLTVGGVIIPQTETVRFTIMPHASQTTYTIFNNRAVGWTVTGITVVPDLAQGGALTATLVKATVNAAPSSGTTPLHTANAIDCNATANTSQVITLTATGADLILAATDKIGIVFSAALTTGILSGTITLKRS